MIGLLMADLRRRFLCFLSHIILPCGVVNERNVVLIWNWINILWGQLVSNACDIESKGRIGDG